MFDQNETNDLLQGVQIGLWKLVIEQGKPVRLYGDAEMDRLLGIHGQITPEARYAEHRKHIVW